MKKKKMYVSMNCVQHACQLIMAGPCWSQKTVYAFWLHYPLCCEFCWSFCLHSNMRLHWFIGFSYGSL